LWETSLLLSRAVVFSGRTLNSMKLIEYGRWLGVIADIGLVA
jgi:hypothetical protein